MRAIDRYILREIWRPLAVTLMLSLVILLIERMLRVLDLVLGSNGPLNLIFQMLAYLVPHYIGLALPLGLFLGVLFGFRRLNTDHELYAIHAAGIGLHGLLRPVILTTVLVAAISAVTISHLQPYARYAYRAVVFNVTNVLFQAILQEGIFSKVEDTTFMTEEISTDKQQFKKVFIYRDEPKSRWVAITAREGRLIEEEAGRLPSLWLLDGVRLSGADQQEISDRGAELPGALRFDELQASLGNIDGHIFRARGEDEREFTLPELWQQRHSPPEGVDTNDMVAEFNTRIVRVLSILVLPLLAVSLARGTPRSARAYAIAIGVFVLLAYNETLNFGKNLVESGDVGPVIGLWIPFLFLAFACIAYFLRCSLTVPGDTRLGWLDWLPGNRTMSGRSGESG